MASTLTKMEMPWAQQPANGKLGQGFLASFDYESGQKSLDASKGL